MASEILKTEEVRDLGELKKLGEKLAATIGLGDWLWLEGELGAGKTALVREILKAWGVVENVTSPTYPILNDYDLWEKKIYHIDAFRLAESGSAVKSDAPWDIAELKRGIVFVEWPERSGLPIENFRYKILIRLAEGPEVVGNASSSRFVTLISLRNS